MGTRFAVSRSRQTAEVSSVEALIRKSSVEFASAYLSALEGVYLAPQRGSSRPRTSSPAPPPLAPLTSSPPASRASTPAAVVEVPEVPRGPVRTGSEGDEATVEDTVMKDAV